MTPHEQDREPARAHRTAPADPRAVATLATRDLDYRTVDPTDRPAAGAWIQAVRRGFQEAEGTDEAIAASLARSGDHRLTGVFDAAAPDPDRPVATVASWVAELTVPGGQTLPAAAISAVTVSPTHRRRGIARAMIEGELATAATTGVPMAMLTVSESQLYGRYGFASAAAAAELVLDVKRAAWTGPTPPGRLDFVSRQRWRELIEPLHERSRRLVAGEIAIDGFSWDRVSGLHPDAKDADALRAVQYRDGADEVRGLAVYSVRENPDDGTRATVTLASLVAETDDAYAALWRFFVELDLVGQVRAGELSVDEPLLWMIDDRRAAVVTVRDHQYLRVIDVPAALTARRWGAPGILAVSVADPHGIAAGDWTLEVAGDGSARVEPGLRADADRVRLGVAELSAAYLGGVPLATLARAGRVVADDIAGASRVFAWYEQPRLSIWY